MKVFENKEFDQVTDSNFTRVSLDSFQELAPTDATYNFGATTAASVGVKVATYFASALALGGSLFVSNQLMTPANLQAADQANAAGQSANSKGSDAAGSAAAGAAGQQGASAGNTLTAEQIAATFAAGGSGDGATDSAFGVTSHGGKRFAKTSTTAAAPSATADPTPSATQDTKVIVPPPALNPGNISSATPSANSQSGSSNYGDDEGDDEFEGDDD